MRNPLVPPALRRRHAQTVRGLSVIKKNYVIVINIFLNLEWHQNPISGSKATAILLKGGFCLLVELLRGRVCVCSLRSSLVSNDSFPNFFFPDAAPGDQCDGGLPPPSPGQVVRGEWGAGRDGRKYPSRDSMFENLNLCANW